ncbi:MAG TPA: Mur ligase domain-containing protein [Myxococcota bacterium]|nr:Mur ligase domain-containing protein [Myxococcota bacterium]
MRIHFIGICGTGMGALALACRARGDEVRGSDTAAYPPMGDALAAGGIHVTLGFAAANLAWGPEVVVVGNVCRKDNPEARAAIDGGLRYTSFPAALADELIGTRHSVVVAGTHGKTTTTALLARLLDGAGRAPGFLIGGVVRDFPLSCRPAGGDVFVVEGDEYDTAFFDKRPKFVHYRARTLLLTSIEYDHADIYDGLDAVVAAFAGLCAAVPAAGIGGGGGGKIFAAVGTSGDASRARALAGARAPVERYGAGEAAAAAGARWVAQRVAPGGPRFVVSRDGVPVAGAFETPLHGEHNLLNACGALAAALSLGVPAAAARAALAGFQGIKRRQEELGAPGGVTVVDDFAHHPTAVRETVAALRERYGEERRLWVLFEPRTQTSRRRVFQKDYAAAFDRADRVVVAGAYGVEALPEADRFSPAELAGDLAARGRWAVHEPDVERIVALVAAEARAGDVVAVFSNGGFGGIHGKLLAALEESHAPAPENAR